MGGDERGQRVRWLCGLAGEFGFHGGAESSDSAAGAGTTRKNGFNVGRR